MKKIPVYWQERLREREEAGILRDLKVLYGWTDFYSNDYLGIARDPQITNMVNITTMGSKDMMNGATGSRLLSGNHIWARRCEFYLSVYYQGENCLLFNSGYDANMGIMACVAGRNDTIIYDELVHASIRDGIRVSVSRSFSFAHNDTDDLRKKLQQATGQVFIVTESVFSMDGDTCPLKEIVDICKEYKALLILDEAHAVGVFGEKGKGLACEMKLEEECFIRLVTFGKGAGVHGAAVICHDEVKKYLVNFCRPFIYSTALPPNDCIAIMAAHEVMQEKDEERLVLKDHVSYFRNAMHEAGLNLVKGNSPICALLIEGNEMVKNTAGKITAEGIGVFAVLSPTVPEGKERLRIILHSYNTREEIDKLIALLKLHGK